MPRRLVKLLTAAVVAYAGVLVVFAIIQRSLLYFPTRIAEADARRVARQLDFEPLPSRVGDILGFRAPCPTNDAEAVLIVAHGNAGGALDRGYLVDVARGSGTRFDVILVEYPGYGARTGKPTETTNVAAVVEAIDLAKSAGTPIVLFGESLGSAVVSLAAAARPSDVSAVVLVTPLPRMAEVAGHHYPFIPSALIADRYEATAAIARYGGPVAFVVAAHDEVIPAPLGLAMHDGYLGAKVLVVDRYATHNTVDYAPHAPTWSTVFAFVGTAIRRPR